MVPRLMVPRCFPPLAALALLVGVSGIASAQNFPVQEHILKNGMKVLVAEDPSIPNVAMYTFFRVGSRNEHEGITGISHFFEHMMFNGAKKYGMGDFDRTMEKGGGQNNAYTSNDLTVYQDWFPAPLLETIFDLEADRVQYLAFDPKIIASERGVVYSERRTSVDNNNFGILYEQMEAAAFTASPYHWPVLGWPSDIEGWTLEDLKSYFSMGYSPSNATMVVVGGVKADEVFRLADKYMGPIPAHDPPPPVRTKEPAQLGERRIYVKKLAQLPMLDIAYHAVDARSPDYYTFQLIDNLLTTGQSSRLYDAIVNRQQLAVSIGTNLGARIDPGLFIVFAQPRQGVKSEAVEKAIDAELDKLTKDGPSAKELEKAKNQAIAAYYRELRSINGRAQAIGNAEVLFGDYHSLGNVEQQYQKVTVADIQRVLKTYLIPTNRTVAILVPTENPSATPAASGDSK